MDVFFRRVHSFLARSDSWLRALETSEPFPEPSDDIFMLGETIHRHLVAIEESGEPVGSLRIAIGAVVEAMSTESLEWENRRYGQVSFVTPIVDGSRGRPWLNVQPDHLAFLLDHSFTASDIARLLGISRSTISRRMREWNMSVANTYSDVNDDEVDRAVLDIKRTFPDAGYRMVSGLLKARGWSIQRDRVRLSVARVDPLGVAERWASSIPRRIYSVSGPNSLWHIDGNHKLIRWRLVIHGGIDGFSRIPVYCQCSNNNRSTTVLRCFVQAVQQFGLPSRVRSDLGMENVEVSRFMLQNRGTGRGSMLTGRSVHNQRIERFWRDVFQGCTFLFYFLFRNLERCSLLNSTSETDLFCLHYVYIPRINDALAQFCEGYRNHRIRTAGNRTPLQLWISGMILGTDLTSLDDLDTDHMATYGIDGNGPIPFIDADDESEVQVPEIPECLSPAQFLELRRQINPLGQSECHGTDIYIRVLEFVNAGTTS